MSQVAEVVGGPPGVPAAGAGVAVGGAATPPSQFPRLRRRSRTGGSLVVMGGAGAAIGAGVLILVWSAVLFDKPAADDVVDVAARPDVVVGLSAPEMVAGLPKVGEDRSSPGSVVVTYRADGQRLTVIADEGISVASWEERLLAEGGVEVYDGTMCGSVTSVVDVGGHPVELLDPVCVVGVGEGSLAMIASQTGQEATDLVQVLNDWGGHVTS